jgi:hypothetical protein
MKASILPSPVESNPLRTVELPKPQPAAGQVLVRVSACGVCRPANLPSCPATKWWAWCKRTAPTRRVSIRARA